MSESSVEEYAFEAEVSQVLSLVINSLYSNKEIFLRELISNASDAVDKVRFEALSDKELLAGDPEFRIRVIPDEEAGALIIEDNGIGMTRDELIEDLGTIAHSGSRSFLEQIKAAADAADRMEVDLIGQFGVGFYSAFLVADEVEVITRRAGTDEAWRWRSDATQGYTLEPTERDGRGTTVVLHLKEEQREYLERWRLKNLISRYSDYVSHSIELPAEGEDAEEGEFERVNKASALWRRGRDEISEEQYHEFYKHLTHDWQEPLAHAHFKLEGMRRFIGLLFVPSQPPFDMFTPEQKHGVRLYVKRVFIMEDCEQLLPKWLRFVRGVIDSDDLPLNVSRETLQDSSTIRLIKKHVTKKTIGLLEEIAADRPEDYAEFWEMFGRVLKEGLHFAPKHKDALTGLVRYRSSTQEGWTSLAEYVERMPEDQPAIYYALGPSLKLLESSPHLEVLKARGYEILYMTDGVDEWASQGLPEEFEGKPLVSALSEELDLGEDEDDDRTEEERAEEAAELEGLTTRFGSILEDRVREVRVSSRLADSPVCLVVPQGGLHAHTERLLRAQDQDVPATQRILEVNPGHKLIRHLRELQGRGGHDDRVGEWIELLYDQALVAEGSPVEDPAAFSRRVTQLLEKAAFSEMMS